MTNEELLQYYANTLPKQYVTLPNAYQTIEALAYIGVMPQDGGLVYDIEGNVVTDPFTRTVVTVEDINDKPILPLAIAPAFNIATAVGQQLDFLAEGIGAIRSGNLISGQAVTLNDSDYRLLLQAVQARNYLRATLAQIQAFVARYFPGILRVTDQLNMGMSYNLLIPLGSLPWVELFITQGFLPRPLGVQMSFTAAILFFGCRTYLESPTSWVLPACTYSAPVSSPTPVLLYSDGLIP